MQRKNTTYGLTLKQINNKMNKSRYKARHLPLNFGIPVCAVLSVLFALYVQTNQIYMLVYIPLGFMAVRLLFATRNDFSIIKRTVTPFLLIYISGILATISKEPTFDYIMYVCVTIITIISCFPIIQYDEAQFIPEQTVKSPLKER